MSEIRKAPVGAKPPRLSYYIAQVHDARAALDESHKAYVNAVADLVTASERSGMRDQSAMRKAHSLIDQAMGDTDPNDPEDPLLRAAQTLASSFN